MLGAPVHIAVIGAHLKNDSVEELAEAVGRQIGMAGAVLVSGGGTGVMEAASRGAKGEGGLTIGILFEASRSDANEFIDVAIPTGLGHMRNSLVVQTADAVIAVGGAWGTLSEIALARCHDKPVVLLASWGLERPDGEPLDVLVAETPEDAVRLALGAI
jgi:uncharacterized protein (TIGR00725 family)